MNLGPNARTLALEKSTCNNDGKESINIDKNELLISVYT